MSHAKTLIAIVDDEESICKELERLLRSASANQPGPGVMKVTAAMTDAETATPVLRSISMIVPQAHMLSNLKYLAAGTFPFVGGAQGEAKITDSVSGDLLSAGIDERIGSGSVDTGFQWQWGDAENATDQWCETLADRLSYWTSSTAVS